jgi:PhzF family phenazine biosynthesis protein
MTLLTLCPFLFLRKASSISHGKEQWYELEIDLEEKTKQKYDGKIKCFIVDAFADPKMIGTGNPAAVVFLESVDLKAKNWSLEDLKNSTNSTKYSAVTQWMQKVANEFNLSETAFIWSRPDKNDIEKDSKISSYDIRYFTPTVEVSLCGHATLASSSVLFQNQLQQDQDGSMALSNTIQFHTIGNIVLKTNLSSFNNNETEIKMSLPALDSKEINSSTDQEIIVQMLLKALNISKESVLYVGIADEIDDLLVEVTYDVFMKLPYSGIDYASFLIWKGSKRGVIISCLGKRNTAVHDENIDFYSRFFGPACGIDEDPVTGSAHCALVPYYSKRLNGKRTMLACQKSKRGGLIRCSLSEENIMVELSGIAVNAVVGHLCW